MILAHFLAKHGDPDSDSLRGTTCFADSDREASAPFITAEIYRPDSVRFRVMKDLKIPMQLFIRSQPMRVGVSKGWNCRSGNIASKDFTKSM